MKNITSKKTQSLSIQSFFLIMGRFLSLPITFLIPIVLVRHLSVEEFGHYKQLLMIFYIALPFVDFGISQGMIYFVPKKPKEKKEIISQFLNYQLLICIIGLTVFIIFPDEFAVLFTGSSAVAKYIPFIGVFLVVWALSNNLEILLTAEKKAIYATLIIFFSEGIKGLLVISVVFLGGKIQPILLVFVTLGFLRILWMVIHLLSEKMLSFCVFKKKLFIEQLKYSLPLGCAVSINALIDYSHQVIVSNQLSAADFAIYSIGCFQIPLIGIVSMYVSQVAIVRICELYEENKTEDIVEIISNSFRKLAIIFFPVFVILWATANEFVNVLYTDAYTASIPVFRTFIWILPIAAILVEYIPRSVGDSGFVFKINLVTLILNVAIVLILLKYFGITGAAAGFVISRVARKFFILNFVLRTFRTSWSRLIPLKELLRIIIASLLSLTPCILLTHYIEMSIFLSLIMQWTVFFGTCFIVFWNMGVLFEDERKFCLRFFEPFVRKFSMN